MVIPSDAEWTSLVTRYADSHEMSYEQAMEYLASRDSLEVGVALIGALPLKGNYTDIRPAVLRFGEYLRKRDCPVPQLWSNTDAYVVGQWSGPPRDHSPKTATREEYLRYRRDGMNRADIARTLGMNPKTLYRLLERWGIKDQAKEREVLAAWKG